MSLGEKEKRSDHRCCGGWVVIFHRGVGRENLVDSGVKWHGRKKL
jgi:hypothetical protein